MLENKIVNQETEIFLKSTYFGTFYKASERSTLGDTHKIDGKTALS